MPSDIASNQEGAALLEAALVLPVLLLLVFGLTDVSLYFWTKSLALKAVQLGARRAILSDAVAVGPGLDPAESATYWYGLPPGARCFPPPGQRTLCPTFQVRCDFEAGCHCTGDACRFRFVARRLGPILSAMQAVMPDLRPENLQITYTTNGFGYVARPVPVQVDVRVSLVGLHYKPLFLGELWGDTLPITASAGVPGEDLLTR
ncbi:TadE/TadG family type IV pilus assembly protein [Lichenifustis flavocetrariae]|uniref:Pilus assembly protein n=1 Tax=Lichenifustis flavocetrariae TaxID=2949735 RepID=A0AA41Z1F4_9HYPH|nr:TadE/TadG family type IV pilus assembly protein [Lichenifustis flavocetrariae]MCW6511949.1 pilus assembly protein [Lichenifustis flavocetrariae]